MNGSPMAGVLRRMVDVKDDEASGTKHLPWLFLGTMTAIFIVHPPFAAMVARLSRALARLGRKAEAIEESVRGASLTPLHQDLMTTPYNHHQLMRVYLLAGETDKALDVLKQLVKIPYVLTRAWPRIDLTFAPLKGIRVSRNCSTEVSHSPLEARHSFRRFVLTAEHPANGEPGSRDDHPENRKAGHPEWQNQ